MSIKVANIRLELDESEDGLPAKIAARLGVPRDAVVHWRILRKSLDARGHELSQCIITDIFMPGINGIELKQRLNQDSCTVPVIMISARLEDRLENEALASGAFSVLRKPFKAQALIQCVERALRR